MRIAQIIPHFYPFATGPGNVVLNISKRLVKDGNDVRIFTSDFGAKLSPQTEIMDGVEINRSPIIRSFMQYYVTPSLFLDIMRFRPDIVHAHNYRSYQTEVAHNFCRKHSVPLIISLNGTAVGHKYMSTTLGGNLPYLVYDKFRGQRQLKDASAIVVNSSREEREAADFVRAELDRLIRIPIGCETHQKLLQQDRRSILFVARITRDRNPCPLIKAFNNCKAFFPDLKFNIVGDEVINSSSVRGGTVVRAKKLVRELNLQQQVSFLGELRGEHLDSEYREADIFVYNSRYENFGIPILEAASYGLPVVASNVGVVPDLIENNSDGLVVEEPDDVEGFTQKILFLLRNKTIADAMGQSLKLKVVQKFNWNQIVSQYLSLYENVISNS